MTIKATERSRLCTLIMKTIEEKKKEIEDYKGVLERYGMGRWRDMGRRHLDDLKEELRILEETRIIGSLAERQPVKLRRETF